ncbi:MAG TPA: 50S ribosomal protein L24 [Thermoanaerobaculia bacterium]|nr:50S ribosomal protein L24 [Thermoanaerobaculia bacterium]
MYGKVTKQKTEPNLKPHVKKGDTVVVLAGKDRGKQAKVLRVMPGRNAAIVERVNLIKKHTKANPQKNVAGGILEREGPVRLSNLQVICPSCSEPTRTGSHRTNEGANRYCRKCNSEM